MAEGILKKTAFDLGERSGQKCIMVRRSPPQTGIDAHEEKTAMVPDQIGNGHPTESLQLFLGEAQGYFF